MVIQLENGIYATVWSIEDIEDYISSDMYQFILNQIEVKKEKVSEKSYEKDVAINDLESEVGYMEETIINTRAQLDEIISSLIDIKNTLD